MKITEKIVTERKPYPYEGIDVTAEELLDRYPLFNKIVFVDIYDTEFIYERD